MTALDLNAAESGVSPLELRGVWLGWEGGGGGGWSAAAKRRQERNHPTTPPPPQQQQSASRKQAAQQRRGAGRRGGGGSERARKRRARVSAAAPAASPPSLCSSPLLTSSLELARSISVRVQVTRDRSYQHRRHRSLTRQPQLPSSPSPRFTFARPSLQQRRSSHRTRITHANNQASKHEQSKKKQEEVESAEATKQ